MKIRAQLEDISSVKKKLTVEVPAKVASEEFERVSQDYKQHARLPGFRPGKAPLALVKKRFAADIRSDVVRKLIPESWDQAIGAEKLVPLAEPELDNLKAEEGQPLSYDAIFEISPVFEVSGYKGLEVEFEDKPVTDEDVAEQLEALRKQNAQLVAVEDRGVESGDQVMVDLKGEYVDEVEGKNSDPVSEEGVIVRVGDEGTQAAFTENLVGANIGEERTFEVEYPEDYPEKKLAGRKIKFVAEVTDVKREELPELNDEFAKDLGDFESLDAIKDRIREDLEAGRKHKRETEIRNLLTKKLIESTEFEVPEVLVDDRVKDRLQSLASRFLSQGIDPSKANINWRGLREEMRPDAEADVRGWLILDEIASKESIEITAEDLNAEITRMAESMNQPAEKVHQYFSQEGRIEGLKVDMRRQRALGIIVDSAVIK